MGTVDTVLQSSTQSLKPAVSHVLPHSIPVNQPQLAPNIVNRKRSAYEEHRCLFGYQPSKVYTGRFSRKMEKGFYVDQRCCLLQRM